MCNNTGVMVSRQGYRFEIRTRYIQPQWYPHLIVKQLKQPTGCCAVDKYRMYIIQTDHACCYKANCANEYYDRERNSNGRIYQSGSPTTFPPSLNENCLFTAFQLKMFKKERARCCYGCFARAAPADGIYTVLLHLIRLLLHALAFSIPALFRWVVL